MRLLTDNEVLPIVTALSFSGQVRPELLNDNVCGPMLRVYLALTDGRLGAELSMSDLFYNRYLWFRRFANAYRLQFGEDGGIEQQAMQILENPNCDVDWSQVEVPKRARSIASRDVLGAVAASIDHSPAAFPLLPHSLFPEHSSRSANPLVDSQTQACLSAPIWIVRKGICHARHH